MSGALCPRGVAPALAVPAFAQQGKSKSLVMESLLAAGVSRTGCPKLPVLSWLSKALPVGATKGFVLGLFVWFFTQLTESETLPWHY